MRGSRRYRRKMYGKDFGKFLLTIIGFFGESEKFWAPENLPIVTQ